MTTYRYKSPTVEAMQLTEDNIAEVMIFAGEEEDLKQMISFHRFEYFKTIVEAQGACFSTSEGMTYAKIGDYVLRTSKGLFVRKPAEFEANYELVGDDETMDIIDTMLATSKHDRVYEEFWKKHLEYEDGELNIEQVRKELADYHMLLQEVPKAYSELAGFSKPHTRAQVIIDAVNERMIDKQMAFDDLLQQSREVRGEVVISVKDLAEYLDIKYMDEKAGEGPPSPKGTLMDTIYSAEGTVPHPPVFPQELQKDGTKLRNESVVRDLAKSATFINTPTSPNGNAIDRGSVKGTLVIDGGHIGSGCSAKAYPANQVPGWAGSTVSVGNNSTEDQYDKAKHTIRFYEDEIVALNDGGVELNGKRFNKMEDHEKVMNILIRSIIQMVK